MKVDHFPPEPVGVHCDLISCLTKSQQGVSAAPHPPPCCRGENRFREAIYTSPVLRPRFDLVFVFLQSPCFLPFPCPNRSRKGTIWGHLGVTVSWDSQESGRRDVDARCKEVPKDGMSSLNMWTALLTGAHHKHGARVPTEAEETPDQSSAVALSQAAIPGVRSQKILV